MTPDEEELIDLARQTIDATTEEAGSDRVGVTAKSSSTATRGPGHPSAHPGHGHPEGLGYDVSESVQ